MVPIVSPYMINDCNNIKTIKNIPLFINLKQITLFGLRFDMLVCQTTNSFLWSYKWQFLLKHILLNNPSSYNDFQLLSSGFVDSYLPYQLYELTHSEKQTLHWCSTVSLKHCRLLTQWGLNEMSGILKTTISNAFSLIKCLNFESSLIEMCLYDPLLMHQHHLGNGLLSNGTRSDNGLLPDGIKPLPDPVLAYYQLNTKEQILVKFKWNNKIFHSRKYIWKCHLQDGGHFVQASKCWVSK